MIATLNDLLFPVELADINEKTGFNTISSTQYGVFGTIEGKDTLLNTCSEIYELVPNDQIFPKIEAILKKAKIPFEVTYKMIDHSRFYADYTLKTGAVSVGSKKDLIYPVIRVTHSYNGLLKYKIIFGWFRLVCGNGLVLPVAGKEEQNVSIVGKHTKQILQSLDTLMDKITIFSTDQEKYFKKFEIIADRSVKNWSDRVIEVMAASGVGKRGYNQITETIEKESGELYKGKVTDWLIYNAFNYHIFNAVTKDGKPYDTAPNLRHDQDKKVFETIYKYKGSALTALVEEKYSDEYETLAKIIYKGEDE